MISGEKEEEGELAVQMSAKDLLKQHQLDLKQKQKEIQKQKALLAKVPTLGKGVTSGQEISLDVPLKKTKISVASELAKVWMNTETGSVFVV